MDLKVLVFDEINSTNAYLLEKKMLGEDIANTVVMARHQTRGRGMGSNSWNSEPGKNLIFITAEAFNYAVIDPELTPTLYRLANEGICFEDYYQPMWGGSTSSGARKSAGQRHSQACNSRPSSRAAAKGRSRTT